LNLMFYQLDSLTRPGQATVFGKCQLCLLDTVDTGVALDGYTLSGSLFRSMNRLKSYSILIHMKAVDL
jgi:hypothetical protein